MADIFISYAREERETASHLAERFGDEGWTVFWDRDLVAGDNWEKRIEDESNRARCVVVLWSAAYSFEQSWVMMIGTTLGLFLVITALGLVLDRALRSGDSGAVPVPLGPVRAEGVSRPV